MPERVAPAFVSRETPSMCHLVFGGSGERGRRERPGVAGLFVSGEENLGGRIADGIVAPWSEASVFAVFEPGCSKRIFGSHHAEVRIGKEIGPGLRREIFRADAHAIVVRFRVEAAESIPEEE